MTSSSLTSVLEKFVPSGTFKAQAGRAAVETQARISRYFFIKDASLGVRFE